MAGMSIEELTEEIKVSGGKSPGAHLDSLIAYLIKFGEEANCETVARIWTEKMFAMTGGLDRRTVEWLTVTGKMCHADPKAR